MPHFDLPLDELREYRSATVAPNDLDAYWEDAIREARDHARPATFEPYKAKAYGPLEAFDVTFSGAAGHPVRAWFLRPRAATAPIPCRVTFIGYGGGRGLPAEASPSSSSTRVARAGRGRRAPRAIRAPATPAPRPRES